MREKGTTPMKDSSRMIGYIAQRITKLTERVGSVGAMAIFCLMLVTSADVTARYIFNSPFLWAFEINEYLLVTVTYLALAYTEAQDRHINITFALSRLPSRVQAGINVATRSAVLFFCAILTWQGWNVFWASWLVREVNMSSVATPVYPSRLVLVIGCFLMCIQLLVTIHKHARILLGKDHTVAEVTQDTAVHAVG